MRKYDEWLHKQFIKMYIGSEMKTKKAENLKYQAVICIPANVTAQSVE